MKMKIKYAIRVVECRLHGKQEPEFIDWIMEELFMRRIRK